MGPFFSQLPLSCEKAGTMEWDSQTVRTAAARPHHRGQGGPREGTAQHMPPSRVGHRLMPCPTSGLGQCRAPLRSLESVWGIWRQWERGEAGDAGTGKAGPGPWARASPGLGPEVLPAICPESLPRRKLLALPCPATPAPTLSRGTQSSVLQWPVLPKLSSLQAPPTPTPTLLQVACCLWIPCRPHH